MPSNFFRFKKEAKEFLKNIIHASDILDISALLEISCGGCHRVYVTDYSPNFVIKVSHAVIERIQEKNYSSRSKLLDHYIFSENEKYSKLYQVFGYSQCILQITEKVNLSISGVEISKASLGAVVIQAYERKLYEASRIRIMTRYLDLEWSKYLHPSYYEQINSCLLSNSSFYEAHYLKINPEVLKCFSMIEKDSDFKGKVVFFVNAFLKYLEKTGIIMDLVGEDNVILVSTDNKWEIKIGSVAKTTTWLSFQYSLICLENEIWRITKDLYVKNALLNGLAACRLINALSLKAQGYRAIPITLSTQQLRNLILLQNCPA